MKMPGSGNTLPGEIEPMHSLSYPPQTSQVASTDAFGMAAAAIAMRRYQVERDIVAVVLADGLKGVPMAAKYGVTEDAFNFGDLRLIFDSARLAGHLGIDALLRVARRGLRHFGFWDAAGPIGGSSCMWSDENLSRLASEWFFSPLVLVARCRELLEIDARQSEIANLLHRVDGLFDGTASPTKNTASRSYPRLVLIPRKRGVA